MVFFTISCGPQYARDPNAHVLVTSKYENEPERIIWPRGKDCKPQLDCRNKSEAECAVALYYDSDKFIAEGKELTRKKLFLSATVEYMQALTRLSEAEIRLERAKTNNFEDYKVIMQFNLKEKIEEKIKFCKKSIANLKWKR